MSAASFFSGLMLLPVLLVLQQAAIAPTTPPSGDTAGYWQQHVTYTIVARLDERADVLHGDAELRYVNHSPDTLREMYVHQYLNAFRPGSKWSAADTREGVERFQQLREPYYGYERFTAPPVVDGTAVRVDYPGAPDSTVAHFALPRPLPPGDSVRVRFRWDARPSATVYRRQGRQGRHYDFAQWYPKVAVYDRLGWEQNPLVPAGELYGEYGTYDVTLVVDNDQVVAATGVPVEGDPGWARVRAWGEVRFGAQAYRDVPPGPHLTLERGQRAVRFYARDVHHFAWTASPDYVYEGSLYRDSIPVHALYLKGQEAHFGHGVLVHWNEQALAWLERIYGSYAYPQLTATIRLDGGATEFPMMAMYGAPGFGTVLHEVGHIYSYGMLGNNEWRSGWMDEGLTQYQSAWAQKFTLQDIAEGAPPPRGPLVRGYRAHAVTPGPIDAGDLRLIHEDLIGRAEPPGTPAYAFHEFGVYNDAIYLRGAWMYGMLREMLGDSGMVAFLHDYYARWRFKHVDELAMRASAERVAGTDLGWFFEQWVHRTGLIDYALGGVDTRRDGDGWTTRVRVLRRGEFRHPMPVGVRTSGGWRIARADPMRDAQWVEVRTAERPLGAQVDPHRAVEDWDRRNDGALTSSHGTRVVFDWPFLDQRSHTQTVAALFPLAWYTAPGGATVALRARTNYGGFVDRREAGVAIAMRAPNGSSGATQLQWWLAWQNPRLPGAARPWMGVRGAAAMLDGVATLELARTVDASPFIYANGPQRVWRVGLTATLPYDMVWADPARWENASVVDANGSFAWRARYPSVLTARLRLLGGLAAQRDRAGATRGFARAEGELSDVKSLTGHGRVEGAWRVFSSVSENAPRQRSIGLSTLDPTETFENHWLRGRDAVLADRDVHFLALGGAGLRGYSPLARLKNGVAANVQLALALNHPRSGDVSPRVQAAVFGDAAWATLAVPGAKARGLADAGVGLVTHAAVYDRRIDMRLDVPLVVSSPTLGVGSDASTQRVTFRWSFALSDLW